MLPNIHLLAAKHRIGSVRNHTNGQQQNSGVVALLQNELLKVGGALSKLVTSLSRTAAIPAALPINFSRAQSPRPVHIAIH